MIKELIQNEKGGISHTKFWSNLAYAVATFKFAITPDLEADIWLAYLGIVGGAAMASKFIQMKYGSSQ